MMLGRFLTLACVTGIAILTLSACKEESRKVAPPPPQKVVFNPEKASELAQHRIVGADTEAEALALGTEYLRITATPASEQGDVSSFLSGIPSDDTKTVIILAHPKNGDNLSLPTVPLFIFEKEGGKWNSRFQANGILTPYFVEQRASLTVSLELVLLTEKLDALDQDAQKVVEGYDQSLVLYSKDSAHYISADADAIIQRISTAQEGSLKDVAQLSIPYLENFANTVNFIGAQGQTAFSMTLSAQGRTSVLPLHHNMPPAYDKLMAHNISGRSARAALGDLENGFWSVPGDALRPSCNAILGALQERIGLSQRDSAIILWRMIQPHALFGDDTDYMTQCSGENVKALLMEMGLTLPPVDKARAASTTVNKMNKALSDIASLVKNTSDKSLERVASMMDEQLVVRDQARLLFSTQLEQLVETDQEVVAPTLDKDDASQYLMMLPIKSYGCFSRGIGQTGTHRATLLELENDPNLWLLDFAFEKNAKINGIRLKKPTQYEFCRAIGGRKGKDRCAFSGKDFPGLTADKCG